MIHVRLHPHEIPTYWEIIKYASAKAENLEQGHMASYFNRLLYTLLNRKAQCFIRLNDERMISAVCITRIIVDEVKGEKSLLVNCLYSFQKAQDDIWREYFGIMKEFARTVNCSNVVASSSNYRVWEICKMLGFEETIRTFSIDL